jgi:glucose-1-phosphate adenylyltransferase
MDLLGKAPLIDMEKWGFRTNLDHRGIRDFQPVVVGDDATVHDSLVYNGSVVDGTVRRSIIFPGVIVEKGAVIEDSVLFFNNHIGRNCRLSKVVADVNNTFGVGVVVGAEAGQVAEAVTVVGWNNIIPNQVVIGEGATIYPLLGSGRWKKVVAAGEVLR